MNLLYSVGILSIVIFITSYLLRRKPSPRKHFKTYGPHKEITSIIHKYNVKTVGEMFYRRVKTNPSAPAYYEKEGKEWVCTSWDHFFKQASMVASYLVNDLHLPRGSKICILGPTKSKWVIVDMGAMLSAGITVGLYPHQTAEQYRYIISNSEADVVFVDGEEETRKVIEATNDLDHVKSIIVWDDEILEKGDYPAKVKGWKVAQNKELEEDKLQERISLNEPAEIAVLVYTSGTTGPPKGVMLSHSNILTLARYLVPLVTFYEDDLSFNFLPLSHVAEKFLGFYPRINGGIVNCFASSVAQVIPELQEVSPTLFGSVPRIFEKAYAKINSDVAKKPKLIQYVFHCATKVALERLHLIEEKKRVGLLLEIKYYFAYKVFEPVRAAFGGRVRQMAVGAAPIDRKILEFFWGCGLKVYEVYGMTELTVVSHVNCEHQLKLGTVGKLVGGECKIAADGEILVRAPFVFEGYYKNPTATAETKDKDGWLHTGDIGEIDDEGFLKITDRKKHLIITSGGKNLSPSNIENSIKNQDPIISQVHAHGDKRPFVVAIITPSPIDTLEWGVVKELVEYSEYKYLEKELLSNPYLRSQRLNNETSKVTTHPEYADRVRRAVQKGNQLLSQVEQVKKFFILDRDFSQENGELTPTMKMKRRDIEIKYASTFDKLYSSNSFGYNVEKTRESE